MTTRFRVRLALLAAPLAYVFAGAVLSRAVFPEVSPDPSDRARRGFRIENPAIKSTFVYRQTGAETDGAVFEVDLFVQPGGGPGLIGGDHVHPEAEERFRVVEGVIRVRLDGVEQEVTAGQEVVVPPGVAHSYLNVSPDATARVVGSFRPAAGMDDYFVQLERAGGLGQVGVVQMMAFLNRYSQTYAAGVPIRLQKAVAFVVAPTARLFGVKSYYPPEEGRPR